MDELFFRLDGTNLLEELLGDELGPLVVHLPRLARMRHVGHLIEHFGEDRVAGGYLDVSGLEVPHSLTIRTTSKVRNASC